MRRISRSRAANLAASVVSPSPRPRGRPLAAGIPGAVGVMVMTCPPSAVAAVSPGPGCHFSHQPSGRWVLVCHNGDGSTVTCSLVGLSAAQISYLRLPRAPLGQKWAALACTGPNPFGGVLLITRPGAPAAPPKLGRVGT